MRALTNGGVDVNAKNEVGAFPKCVLILSDKVWKLTSATLV